MISLIVPLAPAQVAAAGRLHRGLDSWRLTDAALDSLKATLPNFDPVSCMVKAAAVNQFYGTNVYDLPSVARHVAKVMEHHEGIDLVEALAKVAANGKTTRYVGFASKFAHFFIDKERFPIVDSYARIRLNHHLDGIRLPDPPIYAEYVVAHHALIELAELKCSGRELDRYLWLSGLYNVWVRGETKINSEVRALFERAAGDSAITRDLRELSGESD